jgi:hypothetical protein
MTIEYLYFMIKTECKPLYYFLDGQHFKGIYSDSDTEYKMKKDPDIEDLYWVEEMNRGEIHRYSDEEVRTLIGVEIK